MKLKLVMSDAETGEVLQEATDLKFAMMCFATEAEDGLDFESRITTNKLSAYGYAKCLEQVQFAVMKAVREAPKAVQDTVDELTTKNLMKTVSEAIRKQTNGAVQDGVKDEKEGAAE